jgi:hypothetical protein
VLCLRFGHSLDLLYGHLTEDNLRSNEDGVIQITDVCLDHFMKPEWTSGRMVDVSAFWDNIVCRTQTSEHLPKPDQKSQWVVQQLTVSCQEVPGSIVELIERGLSDDSWNINVFV